MNRLVLPAITLLAVTVSCGGDSTREPIVDSDGFPVPIAGGYPIILPPDDGAVIEGRLGTTNEAIVYCVYRSMSSYYPFGEFYNHIRRGTNTTFNSTLEDMHAACIDLERYLAGEIDRPGWLPADNEEERPKRHGTQPNWSRREA